MTNEELTALGLSEEQSKKIIELHTAAVGEKDTRITGLNTQLGEANQKLEGYDPEWKTKAETAKQNAEKELETFKFSVALDNALKEAGAKDAVSVKAHLDMDVLKLKDKSIMGLEEQLKPLKENKGYLFGEEDSTKPFFASGKTSGTDQNSGVNKNEKANAALRAAFGKEG